MTAFQLHPFAKNSESQGIILKGEITLNQTECRVTYRLQGALEKISLPTAQEKGNFIEGLWEKTCFELFLAPQHATHYWEWNFSPTRDWFFLSYEGYRVRRSPPPSPPTLKKLEIDRLSSGFELTVTTELPDLKVQKWDVGISTVLLIHEAPTFWALSHEAAKPDFHQRKSFKIHA